MLVEVPALDWLSLSTFDESDFSLMESAHKGIFPGDEGRQEKIPMYMGKRYFSGFAGAGMQSGRLHYLVTASGDYTPEFALRVQNLVDNTKCTRVDIQLTLKCPENHNARSLKDALENGKWKLKPRQCELWEKGRLHTVYIGAKTSMRRIRWYMKEDDRKRLWLRFEVQIRKPASELVWNNYLWDSSTIAKVLAGEFEKLPKVNQPAYWLFADYLRDIDSLSTKVPKKLTDENGTFRWIAKQVTPAVKRLLGSHTHNERMVRLVNEWVEYANNLSKV